MGEENQTISEGFNADSIPQNASEAEALLNHWQNPDASLETPGSEATTDAEAKPETVEEALYALKYRGVEEKHPISKILEFANQGRDYSEKMRDFRIQRQAFEEESKPWKEHGQSVQEYLQWKQAAEKYPGWLDALKQSYSSGQYTQSGEQQGQGGDPTSPLISRISQLEEKLQKATQFIDSQEQRIKQEAIAEEDATLDQHVTEYRQKNSSFDWDSVDATGRTLEGRILKHAIDNGIKTFRAAANDYLHDEFLKQAEMNAKKSVAKDVKKANVLGLTPPTEKRSVNGRVENVSSKSWDEIAREALSSGF